MVYIGRSTYELICYVVQVPGSKETDPLPAGLLSRLDSLEGPRSIGLDDCTAKQAGLGGPYLPCELTITACLVTTILTCTYTSIGGKCLRQYLVQ